MADLPNIPALSSKVDIEVKRAFGAIKEWVNSLYANGGVVTGRSLVNAIDNIIIPPYTPVYDGSIPPPITGLETSSGLGVIYLTWDAPAYSNLAYVEVYRNTIDDIGGLDTTKSGIGVPLIGASSSGTYADHPPNASLSVTYWYWVRCVSKSDPPVYGPFNATGGTAGNTGNNPAYVLELLESQITSTELHSTLSSRINLIDAAGTGLVSLVAGTQAQVDTISGQVADLAATEAYAAGTTYLTNEMVTYDGKLYQAKSTTTGNLPTNTTYWTKIGDYATLGENVAAIAVNLGTNYDTHTTVTSAIATAKSESIASANGNTASLLTGYTNSSGMTSAISAGYTNAVSTAAAATAAQLTSYSTTAQMGSAVTANNVTIVASLNRSFKQTTAPANPTGGYALTTGDTWYDSDDGNKPYSWSGSAWLDSSDARTIAAGNATAAIAVEQQVRATTIGPLWTNIGFTAGKTAMSAAGVLYQCILTHTTGQVLTNTTYWKPITKDLYAQYTIKTDVNGKVSGIGMANDGATSSVEILSDKFSVLWPDAQQVYSSGTTYGIGSVVRYPNSSGAFYRSIGSGNLNHTPTATKNVSGWYDYWQPISQVAFGTDPAYGLVIDTALIKTAAISNAQISDLNVTKLTAGDITVALNLNAGGLVKSNNFVPGTAGWKINNDGTFEFNKDSNTRFAYNGSTFLFKGQVQFMSSPLNSSGTAITVDNSAVTYAGLTDAKPPTNADHTADNTAYDTTRVGGTLSATVVSGASNGATAYTGTADYRGGNPPTNGPAISSVTYTTSSDGNVTAKVSYTYTQGTVKADSILVYIKEGAVAITTADPAFQTNPLSGSMTFNVKPSTAYLFNVQAIKVAATGSSAKAMSADTASTSSAGNYTGNVNGTAAATVVSNTSTALTNAATAITTANTALTASSTAAAWVKPSTTLIDGNKIYTGDAYVDTLQIKGEAVTVTRAAEIASGTSVSVSVPFTQAGSAIILVTVTPTYNTGGAITQNGVTKKNFAAIANFSSTYSFLLDVTAGTHTFAANMTFGGAMIISVFGAKR
jgi:hypothetical protein